MRLKELAGELGIADYPEKFEEIYNSTDLCDTSFCDASKIREFDAEYNVFKEYLPDVIEGARDLATKPNLIAWGNVICEYLKTCTREEINTIPYPESDGSAAGNMFRLFILLSVAPRCAEGFKNHGFSHEEIADIFNVFYICLNLVKAATGAPGINKIYTGWCFLYLTCEMYNYGSFNFQFRKMTSPIILLKNKRTGKHTILMTDGRFHKSGQVLGSAGYEDEEGAFDADFKETDDAFIGHIALDGFVMRELSEYKKSEWECVLKNGDDVLSVHIPRNVDLSIEAIRESYAGGMRLASERFPEYSPKYLHCSSWIIDPRLENLLGEKSKIVGFGKTFMRFPLKCGGRDGFSFFFLGHNGTEEELPENTSLQRKIKELYLSGGYTYSSGGIVAE